MSGAVIAEARWPQDRPDVEMMFREYAASLGVDLRFQNFEQELASLPGKYARPHGSVLLARVNGAVAAIGCCRPWEGGCEMKRLYVRPEFRGLGLGRDLAVQLIAGAQACGHSFMVLDSLSSMGAAQALYRALGFRDTAPYYENPLPGTIYMRLDLDGSGKPPG